MAVSFICLAAPQHCLRTAVAVLLDLSRFALLMARSRSALAAENLILRKQLAFFQERKAKPRRADDATRWIMMTLSHLFPWRGALVNVKAGTFIGCLTASGHQTRCSPFWRVCDYAASQNRQDQRSCENEAFGQSRRGIIREAA
jgi:hypothetical protein